MVKYFFKIFGIIIAILAAVGMLIAGIVLAFCWHFIAGIIASVLGIAGFVATLITIVEYSTSWL